MPSEAILDIEAIDPGTIVADTDAIQLRNAQRFEFALLDAVVHEDLEGQVFAGYHDVRPDAWWTRGHIPGRPLFPGVLMIELAAQLASYAVGRIYDTTPEQHFLGFTGVDEVKFRSAVTPPAKLVVVGRIVKVSTRRIVLTTQEFVDHKMVFEGQITGMRI